MVPDHPQKHLKKGEEDHPYGKDRQGERCLCRQNGVDDIAEVKGADDPQDVQDDAGEDGLQDGADMGLEERKVFGQAPLSLDGGLKVGAGGKEHCVTGPVSFEFPNADPALSVGGVGDPYMAFCDSIDHNEVEKATFFALVGNEGKRQVRCEFLLRAFHCLSLKTQGFRCQDEAVQVGAVPVRPRHLPYPRNGPF